MLTIIGLIIITVGLYDNSLIIPFQELKHNVHVQTIVDTNKTLPPSIPVVGDKGTKQKYASIEMPAHQILPARFKEVKFEKTVRFPQYCGRNGAMCERVDSRLLPERKKRQIYCKINGV